MPAIDRTPTAGLAAFGAVCAVVGGALRVVSTFIPWAPASPWLETLYGVIDVCLLFGLIAVYLRTAERIGVVGLFFFAVSLGAEASIVGPDAVMFGIDFYQLGCAVLLIGLLGLSVQMLRVGVLRVPAGLWLASVVAGFGANAIGGKVGVLAAGAILGVGFLCAGVLILHRPHLTAAAG
jgi:hypothetical protein